MSGFSPWSRPPCRSKCSQPTVPLEACPPDEVRWLGLGDYLNTSTSPLNPQNRGYGFFVYGDFPIVCRRYIAEWVGQTGYDQVNLVGRQVSALSDLLTSCADLHHRGPFVRPAGGLAGRGFFCGRRAANPAITFLHGRYGRQSLHFPGGVLRRGNLAARRRKDRQSTADSG